MVRQTAVINIMALGMTIIIISGGIDLSVGAILAMGGLLGTMAMENGMPRFSLGVVHRHRNRTASCGSLNGMLITRLRIAPFIVTLGTLGIFRGITLIKSNGLPVHEIPQSFSFLGEGNLLGRSIRAVASAALCGGWCTSFWSTPSWAGTHLPSAVIPQAAFYAGIPVGSITRRGVCDRRNADGLAGMIEASRLMTGQPTAGQGYELQAIAAVVIGGGSLTRRRRQRARHADRRVHHGAAFQRQRSA